MVQGLRDNWGNFPELIENNYWSVYNTEAQNQAAKYPRLTYANANSNYVMSDFWLFDGSYFRLKNITLGYNIPSGITEKIHLQGARIYASASDFLSINNYPKGWDPEVSGTGYPITASFIFGVSVKF